MVFASLIDALMCIFKVKVIVDMIRQMSIVINSGLAWQPWHLLNT